jgi:hypothetical protein
MTTLLLIILERVEFALRESTLKAEAQLQRRVGETEFADALRELRNAKFIESSVNPLTKDISWQITKAGIAYLKGGK